MKRPDLASIEATLQEFAFPKKFAVEVCAECNLACFMCHHPTMRRPKGIMPVPLWEKCADEIAERAPATECWFSFCGEPLLEPERLMTFLRYGKSVGLTSLNVNTNGMLLTPELAGPLMDTGVDLIVIGIDGLSAPVYEAIRVNALRDVAYANVEHLLAARDRRSVGPEIQVQFIVMDENEHETEEFTQYWLERGATVKVRNKLSWGGKFETSLCVPLEERIPCPWSLTMMHVFWDGRVPRCPGDTEGEEGAGNAWDESLAVLWGRLGGYRRKHLDHRFEELPERCLTCTDWMTGAAARIRPTQRPFTARPAVEPLAS
ncbi:MAG TPA: radical SAM/SPASM domain-containing protein [Gemmatimonadales bacterium]